MASTVLDNSSTIVFSRTHFPLLVSKDFPIEFPPYIHFNHHFKTRTNNHKKKLLHVKAQVVEAPTSWMDINVKSLNDNICACFTITWNQKCRLHHDHYLVFTASILSPFNQTQLFRGSAPVSSGGETVGASTTWALTCRSFFLWLFVLVLKWWLKCM